MAEQVDAEARLDSRKALLVIMILAILAATGYFFYVFLDKTFRFFYSTRRYLIFILTAGDLFLALFPLIVYARATFERKYRPGCSTSVCATVYLTSYFPFVYATGIILMSVELVFRHRIRAFFPKQEFCSVFVAALPWLIGLVLILPLNMAGMDWEDCTVEDNTRSRQRAVVWISVVLPSLFAVIGCIIVKHAKFNVVPKGRYPGETNQVDNVPGSQASPPQPTSTAVENGADQPVVLTTSQLEASVEKEKTTNLTVAVIFFVLTLPQALFTLGYALNDDAEPLDPVPRAVLKDLFFWMHILRSAVLPVVWARLTLHDVL